jgi:hypothetical protein
LPAKVYLKDLNKHGYYANDEPKGNVTWVAYFMTFINQE